MSTSAIYRVSYLGQAVNGALSLSHCQRYYSVPLNIFHISILFLQEQMCCLAFSLISWAENVFGRFLFKSKWFPAEILDSFIKNYFDRLLEILMVILGGVLFGFLAWLVFNTCKVFMRSLARFCIDFSRFIANYLYYSKHFLRWIQKLYVVLWLKNE